ncbi:MAG TPA: hypothetical protein VHT34_02645 [Clostridia bacterium]|nr:hypothetical protein [Clostridia bacterium]
MAEWLKKGGTMTCLNWPEHIADCTMLNLRQNNDYFTCYKYTL